MRWKWCCSIISHFYLHATSQLTWKSFKAQRSFNIILRQNDINLFKSCNFCRNHKVLVSGFLSLIYFWFTFLPAIWQKYRPDVKYKKVFPNIQKMVRELCRKMWEDFIGFNYTKPANAVCGSTRIISCAVEWIIFSPTNVTIQDIRTTIIERGNKPHLLSLTSSNHAKKLRHLSVPGNRCLSHSSLCWCGRQFVSFFTVEGR